MKININIIRLIMISIMISQALEAKVTYRGGIKLGLQYHDSASDIALGGNLHAEGMLGKGLSLGATLESTQALLGQHDAQGMAFFSHDAKGYSILSEAYIKGVFGKTEVTFGRQSLDTPFLDSDDIGMIANHFEAYTLSNQDIQDTILFYTYVRQMSGVDADIPESFTSLNPHAGLHTLGLMYETDAGVSLSAWYYTLPNRAQLSYADFAYEGQAEGVQYAFAVQMAWQAFVSQEQAKVFGLTASLSHDKSALTCTFSYDSAIDAGAVNGFGGGPYFVNMEHLTLQELEDGGDVFVYGLEWNPVESVSFASTFASLEDTNANRGEELDMLVHYAYHDRLSFDAIYSKIDNIHISGDRFDNVRVFANYRF